MRAHVICGGFPRGSHAGHDHDYARLRILRFLADAGVKTSVANDYAEIDDWLDRSRLLVTYTAGPFADASQAASITKWMGDGGRWIGLHGTSGGKAKRVDGGREMVRTEHHDALGGFFLNHPPVRRFTVDVVDGDDVLTRDMPASFEVIDEPYMIEVRDPSARTVLTAALGPDPGNFGFTYERDTALHDDGVTRTLGFVRDVGSGGVCYLALGHCHDPETNVQPFVDTSVDPDGSTPLTLRQVWETDGYQTLLRNAIAWGLG